MLQIFDKYGNQKLVTSTGATIEYDPIFEAWLTGPPNISEFTNDSGYLTSFSESDPIYTASTWFSTINNSTNWNTAFGWGNHASAGYGNAFVANPLSQFAATTSLQLKGVISDETGSDALVFANTPTLVTPILGAATGTSLVLGGSLGASALLDVQSTTKGLLVPRMTNAQMLTISSPADGLQIYNTDFHCKMYYSNDWEWVGESSDWKRRNMIDYFNDFLGVASTVVQNTTDGNLITFAIGGLLTSSTSPSANHQGIISLSTNVSATGRAGIGTSTGTTNPTMILGGGRIVLENLVRVTTLSTGSERFQFLSGFSATNNSTSISNGVLFAYDEGGVSNGSTASANWQVATMASNVRSWTTTSVAVTAGQWYKLTAIINAAGTSVDFYIDDVLVKTETTNIPTLAVGIMTQLYKSVGTTARTVDVDYISFKQKFTTVR